MKFSIEQGRSDEGGLEGELSRISKEQELGSEGYLKWEPEVQSDDEGHVPQPSFILNSEVMVDEHGNPCGKDPTIHPAVGAKIANAHGQSSSAWKGMFRDDQFGAKCIKDHKMNITDDSVDMSVLNDTLFAYYAVSDKEGPCEALDLLLELVRVGLAKPPVGAQRKTKQCKDCCEPLFRPVVAAGLRICVVCNDWLHGDCYAEHMKGHVTGLLCLGWRKQQKAKSDCERARAPRSRKTPSLRTVRCPASRVMYRPRTRRWKQVCILFPVHVLMTFSASSFLTVQMQI
jgi:hypothetical protein